MQGELLAKQAKWQRLALNAFAILVLGLAIAIGAQVLLSFFNINPLAQFDDPAFLFGNAITLNSLLDLQWHLLCVIGLLPAGIVWLNDGHIRVDFLYSRQSPRQQVFTELCGHVIFTIPFLIMSIPAAWSFMMSAYQSGQGSANDGLNNLFVVKATLPLGLLLLALVVARDIAVQVQRWRSR